MTYEDMMTITEEELDALKGFSRYGHFYLTRTDAADPMIDLLLKRGLLAEWQCVGGFPAIGLTPAGRDALATAFGDAP